MGLKIIRLFEPLIRVGFIFSGSILQKLHPEWHGRRWSNMELQKWGKLFSGDVINVSGWDDRDKEGGKYVDYFPNKSTYTISNIHGARGSTGAENEIYLDLSQDLPENLVSQFDVVLNHTTLEHIYNIQQAVCTLCALSRDIVIVIVPFIQRVHWEPDSFLDYWRPTPFALKELFETSGLELVYWNWNDNPVFNVYTICVGSKKPTNWKPYFGTLADIKVDAAPGSSLTYFGKPISRNRQRSR
jgi:hypothetical protein